MPIGAGMGEWTSIREGNGVPPQFSKERNASSFSYSPLEIIEVKTYSSPIALLAKCATRIPFSMEHMKRNS